MNGASLLMMLDVESILAETGHFDNGEMVFKNVQPLGKERTVFNADDFSAARNHIPLTSGVMQAKMSHGEDKMDGGQDGMPNQPYAVLLLLPPAQLGSLLLRGGGNEKFGINVF